MKWTKNNGVQLTSELENFLDKVSDITDVPIHVTSGFRSEEEQVEVVCNNTIKENGRNLSVYQDQKEKELYRTECKEGGDRNKIIEYLKSRGPKSHGTGGAIDVRSNNLSELQIEELTEAFESEGASVLREFNPPHLHVDTKGGRSTFSKKYDELKLNITDKAIMAGLLSIYEDTPECEITEAHVQKVKEYFFENSFLEGLIRILVIFFGLDRYIDDKKIKEFVANLLKTSSEKDMEDIVSFLAEENSKEIFKNLCVPKIKKTKSISVTKDLKKLEFKERYNKSYVNLFYSAIQIKETNNNPRAFGKDGEISSVQLMFFNAINWFGEDTVFQKVAIEKNTEMSNRLRDIYNKYKNDGKRNREESVEAGRILQGISLFSEENIRKVSINKMREYFEESEDFYNVACKWNTGKSENPCSRNMGYPVDVLNNMISLLDDNQFEKTSNNHSENMFLKKVAFNFILQLNKMSNTSDLKHDFKKSNKYDKASRKLLKFI